MRGEVLHFDEEQGFGFITGADGKRYAFERGDLRRLVPITKGTTVEFQVDAASAREIFVVHGLQPGAPTRFGRDAVLTRPQSTDLWSYFWRGITSNYANFRDRAPRKEFWSYIAFWTIIFIVLVIGSFAVDVAVGNLDTFNDMVPAVSLTTAAMFVLATIVPWIALTVRRLHDVGMSGWLALLIHPLMLVWLGYLVLLVIGLIPSQASDNKWGPVPRGVQA
jgi:uncharacterized membrane protein YhaH (DUF805 family)/cold shock CspA family protein